MVIGGGTIEADEGEYFGVFSRTGDKTLSQDLGFVICRRFCADAPKDAKKAIGEFFPSLATCWNGNGTCQLQ